MAAVAEDGLSVVLSSHVIADLERVADYLIVLSHGQVQVAGEVEALLAVHAMLTGPAAAADIAERLAVVHARRAGPWRSCWSGTQVPPTRRRPDGKRTPWAWRNSSSPTCASRAPARCRGR